MEHSFLQRPRAQGDAADCIGVDAVPTFIFGNLWAVEGAVPLEMLRRAAQQAGAAS